MRTLRRLLAIGVCADPARMEHRRVLARLRAADIPATTPVGTYPAMLWASDGTPRRRCRSR